MVSIDFRASKKGGSDVKAAIDSLATADYVGAASNDGFLRTSSPLTYTDGGNYITLGINQSAIDHGSLGGLADDDHTQYALLAGRSGGQTLFGGSDASDKLILESTSNATKGEIVVNESGSNQDFRVEGLTKTGLLLVDADKDSVNIGDPVISDIGVFQVYDNNTDTSGITISARFRSKSIKTSGNYDTLDIVSQYEPASSASTTFRSLSNTAASNSNVDFTGDIVAYWGYGLHGGTGTASTVIGCDFSSINNSSSGTITNAIGARFEVKANVAGGTITNAYGLQVLTPTVTGTITNAYGMYIKNQTGATTLNYALVTEGGDIVINENGTSSYVRVEGSTNTNLLYIDGTNDKIGIGTNSPDRLYHIESSTALTNTVSYAQRLSHITSNTPANGIGVGIEFEVETTAGNNEVGAILEAVVSDVTSTSEDFDFIFKNMLSGSAAAERMRIRSDGDIWMQTGVLNFDSNETTGAGTATLTASSSSVAVSFDNNMDDTSYVVAVEVPYQTSFWITNKATTGFTINVGTTNAYDQTIEWSIRTY